MDRHGIATYDALLARSMADPEWFWRAVLDDLGIEFYEPYHAGPRHSRAVSPWTALVRRRPHEHRPQLPRQVDRHADRRIGRRIRWEGEEGTDAHADLRRAARATSTAAPTRCARSAWRKGDRVALFMPMCPELVVAFFAVIKIGGVVLPLFSGYGADAVATRLQDCGRDACSSPPTASGGAASASR